MSNRDGCVEYFKAQPEFERIFVAMRKKWESLGRIAGRVTISHVTEEERAALEGLLGRSLSGEDLSFSLGEFEKALGETRYGAVGLLELLEGYFGEPLSSTREKKRQREEEEQAFFAKLEDTFGRKGPGYKEGLIWTREMRQQKNGGYACVKREYHKSPEVAQRLVEQVGECLRLCPGEDGRSEILGGGVRLAVLAAQVWGNPHALDRQTPGGLLFTHALCRRKDRPLPGNAQAWKDLYEENDILVDDLSSTVIAYGIHLYQGQEPHPAYEGYARMKEPCVVTLANLAHIERALGESDRIFIVENEMVFRELLERATTPWVTLLCTSGQPRTAAYQLMELLCEAGSILYYAGDLDPEGLDIADRLWRRFPNHIRIWRMGEQDYEKSLSQEPISPKRLKILENITHPELKQTAARIRECKRAGYQELLLEDLAEDINRQLCCM